MAAFTLFDLHVNAHEQVGTINYGESSASTGTTSIEDQTISTAHVDDQFNGGTIYFIKSADTNTTALFINQQFERILDYDASSGQYTFGALVTSGGTSGLLTTSISYGVATPEFNLQLMNRLSMAALRTLGPFVYMDRSLQSSGNQKVYQLSTVATRGKPFRIDIMGRSGSSQDNPDWTELHGWYMEPSTVGAGQRVVFPRSLPSGRDIRIYYEADHPEVTASTAIIDGRIHPELATLALVDKMYQYRNSRSRGAEEFDVQRWNDAKRQLAEARVRWPISRPKKKATITVIGRTAPVPSVDVPPWGAID